MDCLRGLGGFAGGELARLGSAVSSSVRFAGGELLALWWPWAGGTGMGWDGVGAGGGLASVGLDRLEDTCVWL